MSKLLGIALASTFVLAAIPAFATQATGNNTVVYNNDGQVIGQDPDSFIRLMLLREEPSKHGD